ncbi:1-deoxy-D-xylulose-5-phosphate reductoisomerase [Thiotrichales bacterium 19S3-7]|nr:1-deoxy-D-xylulose-5-phosphate reductoisomerase [Thiotrichales bacterium 19S3-7]MCF6801323.1 1-deoxy-D-xylulose-5-phosphate reductoisomerase [Thiotrichales bacterium 19S3-11]
MRQTITILGSTGSIGKNTLNVIQQHQDLFEVFAITAYRQIDVLFEQIQAVKPKYAVVVDSAKAKILEDKLKSLAYTTEVLSGEQAVIDVAKDDAVDTVMAAIVGIAGLKPTYEAAKKGKRILLANKETLVASGHLFMEQILASGAQLIPVDSEHNAIYQCLPDNNKRFDPEIMHSVILTASGGPFRNRDISQLNHITPAQAIKHPNWSMGAKISIDSATMVNKALEMTEAYWLFDVPHSKLNVVIHPQSIVHSMVHYKDGSYLAQIGSQDMKTPIAYSLFHPKRYSIDVAPLNLFDNALTFEPVNYERFPSVKLMYQIMSSSDFPFYSIVYNAVNEQLVADFIEEKIAFSDIVIGIEKALNEIKPYKITQIDDVFQIDSNARQWAQSEIFTLIQSKE